MRLLLDACVLYPTVMREVLTGSAAAGLFVPRWSDRVLEEWARATIRLGPDAEAQARGEIAHLKVRFPNAIVAVPPGLETRLWLPDANDVHVLAAAVAGSCDGIVTLNTKDFPGNLLAEEGLFRSDPDGLMLRLHDEAPQAVAGVCAGVLAQVNAVADRAWEMRALMKKARMPRLGKRLVAEQGAP